MLVLPTTKKQEKKTGIKKNPNFATPLKGKDIYN